MVRQFRSIRFGYPTELRTDATAAMTNVSCQQVFNTVLQSAPRNAYLTKMHVINVILPVSLNGAGGSANSITGTVVAGLDLCVYHQVASLVLNQTNGVPTPAPDLTTAGAKGIVYNPARAECCFTQTPFVP